MVSKRVVIVLLAVLCLVVVSYGRGRYTITIGQHTIPAFRDTIPIVQDTIPVFRDTIPAMKDSAAISATLSATDTIAASSDTLTYPYGIMEIDTMNFWKCIDTLTIHLSLIHI